MHIPDGFLTAKTLIPAWVLSAGGIVYSFRQASRILQEKMIPLMGVMAAFIFAAQMLNFPVIGGTSGHLMGTALAVIMLGPYCGAIVMMIVLIVQSLIFQDGGLIALGAYILNMACIGSLSSYIIFYLVGFLFKGKRGLIIATALAAFFSVALASFACAMELGISGTVSLAVVLPAMLGIHTLIGIGEAIITVFIVIFVSKVRPDLITVNRGFAHED